MNLLKKPAKIFGKISLKGIWNGNFFNMNKDKHIDLFPITEKEESVLSVYISSKDKIFNQANEENRLIKEKLKEEKKRKQKLIRKEQKLIRKEEEQKRKQRNNVIAHAAWEIQKEKDREADEALEYDLIYRIFNYIEANKLKIKPPVFKIIEHKKPVDQKYGFIHLNIAAPMFPKIKNNRDHSAMEKEFYRKQFNLTLDKPLSMDSLALYMYGYYFDTDLDEGHMGWGNMGLTSLIGGIKRHAVKTKAYTQMYGSEEEFFLDGPKGTYAFFAESLYKKDYFEDHTLNFKDNFDINFDWAYPWYFTVFEDSIEEAGEEFFKYFLEHGLEY